MAFGLFCLQHLYRLKSYTTPLRVSNKIFEIQSRAGNFAVVIRLRIMGVKLTETFKIQDTR
jgi:hypothetical protein